MADVPCDVLVIGASLGGVAAALRAAIGADVCLVEPSGWIGGQMTGQGVTTGAVMADAALLRSHQKLLLGVGVPLFWWSDVPFGHPAFEVTQLLGVEQVFHGNGRDLALNVDTVLTAGDAQVRAASV